MKLLVALIAGGVVFAVMYLVLTAGQTMIGGTAKVGLKALRRLASRRSERQP